MALANTPTELASPVLPGCAAWVTVDGRPLTVYSATVEGNKSIGYVEAVEGAHFEVHFGDQRQQSPLDDFNLDVYLDGRWVRGSTHRKTSTIFRMPLEHPHRLQTFRAARISPTTERKFLFSKLVTTDEEDLACKEENVIKGIGSIQLRMMRISDVQDKIEAMESVDLPKILIHEESKQVRLTHQTSLGPAQVTEVKRIAMKFNLIDTPSKPFANFEFRYRSRALLEIEGLAPPLHPLPLPPPSPPPLTAADPRPRSRLPPPPPSPPLSILKQPPLPKKAPKRQVDIIIESSDDEGDGSTEVQRLQNRVAELERRDRVKNEPPTPKFKEEKATRAKKLKREKGVALAASGKGKKGERVVIELD